MIDALPDVDGVDHRAAIALLEPEAIHQAIEEFALGIGDGGVGNDELRHDLAEDAIAVLVVVAHARKRLTASAGAIALDRERPHVDARLTERPILISSAAGVGACAQGCGQSEASGAGPE